MTPIPSSVQNKSKTPPIPTIWRLWADSLGLRSSETITYRKEMRITAAAEAILSCAEQSNNWNPVSALLRGPDYDIEAGVRCVLNGAGEETNTCLTVLDIGVLVFTNSRYHSEDFMSLAPITAICSLRLDTIGVGKLERGQPNFDNLIHTWEIVSIHRATTKVEIQLGETFSPRHDFRLEEADEATLEAFDWTKMNAGPAWVFECRLVAEGGASSEATAKAP